MKRAIAIGPIFLLALAFLFLRQQRKIDELRERQTDLEKQVEQLAREKSNAEKARVTAERETATARAALAKAARPLSAAPASSAPAANATRTPAARNRGSPAEKAELHARYDPFLRDCLALTPAQADRFVDLKIAIFAAKDDLQAAMIQAKAAGGTPEIDRMRDELTKPMWDEIRSLLGKEGYAALGDYETMSAYRPMVTGMFRSPDTMLSESQIDGLTRLVVKNNNPVRLRPTDLSMESRIDWNAVARDAESSLGLTPAQLAVLRSQAARP